ncbi:MAG TPA: hypothetical protein VND93_25505, partial [Myxococcales bacterium]|nr:hypothetical protein [Myxococcales bacterium]
DVMAQQAKGPTGARGPPRRPPAEWDRAVPLGVRSGDAFDPDPAKGQCSAWVWVMIMRNAGWSGAVAVDPRAPVPGSGELSIPKLVKRMRDPVTGDPLVQHSGTPEELMATAHGLAPGTQIIITVRSRRGALHQMLGVVQAGGTLDVMHSYAPDRILRPGGGVDRVFFAQQGELAQYTDHKWVVLPPISPPPPPRFVPRPEEHAPVELEPPVRRKMEQELRAQGHDPEVLKQLTDQELFTAFTRTQAELAGQRIEEFRRGLPPEAKGKLDELRGLPELARMPISELNLKNRVQDALRTPVEIDNTLK